MHGMTGLWMVAAGCLLLSIHPGCLPHGGHSQPGALACCTARSELQAPGRCRCLSLCTCCLAGVSLPCLPLCRPKGRCHPPASVIAPATAAHPPRPPPRPPRPRLPPPPPLRPRPPLPRPRQPPRPPRLLQLQWEAHGSRVKARLRPSSSCCCYPSMISQYTATKRGHAALRVPRPASPSAVRQVSQKWPSVPSAKLDQDPSRDHIHVLLQDLHFIARELSSALTRA